jgi:AcrR family transcriptional regulator
MSRPLDTTLEKRLLEAARQLLRKGEKSLTMRALARAAKTHAPGIYSRFRNRQDIMQILSAQFEKEIAASLTRAVSVEAATRLYLEFAINHPKEYEILFTNRGTMPNRLTADDLGPVFQWLHDKLTKSLTLEPAENTHLALTIWTLWHGTATLLIDRAASAPLADSVASAAEWGVKTLMQEAGCRNRPQAETRDSGEVWHPA